MKKVVVGILVLLGLVVVASQTEAAPSAIVDEDGTPPGGKCGPKQFWCGTGNLGACCGEHAVCCRRPGGNPHCGYGMHPCR